MKEIIPPGLTVIYFNNEKKNIYAKMPLDKEQAKRLSKRIYKDAMVDLSSKKQAANHLVATLFPNN